MNVDHAILEIGRDQQATQEAAHHHQFRAAFTNLIEDGIAERFEAVKVTVIDHADRNVCIVCELNSTCIWVVRNHIANVG